MNDIATKARAAAAHFEAKKDGLRQTQTEWKITLTATDLPAWLRDARMGTRIMVAVVEIAEDETPVEHAKDEERAKRGEQDSGAPKVDTDEHGTEWSKPVGLHPLVTKSSDAKDRFRSLGKPEQMVTRCAMLCGDPEFWNWLWGAGYEYVKDADTAAEAVRDHLGIKSRSELASNPQAQHNWERMVTDYDVWRGALPEIR